MAGLATSNESGEAGHETISGAGGFNGKLRDELLNGEILYILAEATIVIEQWRKYYNTVRPHSSLAPLLSAI